jgi:hypothetical protein
MATVMLDDVHGWNFVDGNNNPMDFKRALVTLPFGK